RPDKNKRGQPQSHAYDLITLEAIYGTQQSSDSFGLENGSPVIDRGHGERPAQIGGWVALGPPRFYCIAGHHPPGAAQPRRRLVLAAGLDAAKREKNLGDCDVGHGSVTECRKGEIEQPPRLCKGARRPPLALELFEQLLSDQPEGDCHRLLVQLALNRRVTI